MDTVRSWKDPHYRRSLGTAGPAHPSGAVPLDDADLAAVSGGTVGPIVKASKRYCPKPTPTNARRLARWVREEAMSDHRPSTPPNRHRPKGGGGGGTAAKKY